MMRLDSPAIKPRLLKAEEVQVYLRLSCGAFSHLRAHGKLPEPLRFGTKTLRWDKNKLDAWLDELSGIDKNGTSQEQWLKRIEGL